MATPAAVAQGNGACFRCSPEQARARSQQRHRLTTAFEVTYQGKVKPLLVWVKGKSLASGGRINVRDVVNTVGSVCLAPHFEDIAPNYPSFSLLLTNANRELATLDALKIIGGGARTKVGIAVLDALELLNGDRLDSTKSQFAASVLEMLKKKGHGQVVNRSELVHEVYGVEYFAPEKYRLEPEWLVILLASSPADVRDAISARVEDILSTGTGKEECVRKFIVGERFLESARHNGFGERLNLVDSCARIILNEPKKSIEPFRVSTDSSEQRVHGTPHESS